MKYVYGSLLLLFLIFTIDLAHAHLSDWRKARKRAKGLAFVNIDLDAYVNCRIALAMAMLAEPNNPKHRKTYVALHDALMADADRDVASTQDLIGASQVPMLLQRQAE